ncbi:3-dehydroquinate synthase [Methylocella silvestris BL2]|uniref:Multifunctional fusion protein n=1 Tax=Methylocella silvestris (strain DSM 15510 / CIP 108128 / LMG 27833 / NCIMB 13906 / BL2) TaxID=395965 RepID=B8EID0_METSB|nr:3-dehydroquinate synthase [Methylocella silvestris]ACK51249.1 3-dehydroquinate synthase [Methylocella silvestris BL2]
MTSSESVKDRPESVTDRRLASLVRSLGDRSIVLVGFMGCGKTSTGRRLAQRLGLPFIDADAEIEAAAGMTIAEIFARHGEPSFRDGERRVMARLLEHGPRVIATGGGAFLNEETRARIARRGVSVWLKAEPDVLWRRVRKRSHRPLLQSADPEKTLRTLLRERYPYYARADVTVISRDGPHETAVEEIIAAVEFFMRFSPEPPILAVLDPMNHAAKPPLPPIPSADGEPLFGPAATTAPAPAAQDAAAVRVELGERSYDILIGAGLIAAAGACVRRLAPGAACAIVTDANVAALHLAELERSLREAGVRYSAVIIPPGEQSKSYGVFAKVCDDILAARLERGDLVIALGGGVIGDLAGFAAASIRRGMRFVQIPTSLLAQVDSSVGGKTGINSEHGKNLIGAFHQPSLVLADADALATLPLREFRAGYAEIVKYGLIGDAPFFAWLETHWRGVFAGGPDRVHAIATSCRAKAAIVGRDERESGERALLNLGHTFGHALERINHYDGERLVHGEAVSVGLALAFRFCARVGLCEGADADRVEAHLREVGLPTRIADIPGLALDADQMLDAMRQDKKVERGALTFVLARAIGDCFVAKSVEAAEVRAFLEAELNTGL